MIGKGPETREKLLEVATEVFYEKGFYGARMQEIADLAKINKAMLHYYFSTKEQLFDAVFQQAIGVLLPALQRFFSEEGPLGDKISRLIDDYTSLLDENPHVPAFVLSELRMHPDKIAALSQNAPFKTGPLLAQIQAEVQQGRLRPIDPHHFVLHLFSCCIFPYISGLLWRGFFGLDDAAYQAMLRGRKQSLMDMFWLSLAA